jgi:hypothetical protein
MFLHRLTRQIARELDMEYFSINNKGGAGYQEVKELSWNGFIQKSLSQAEKRACFGPIRSYEAMPSIPEGVEDYSIILHLRDPRDMLVSLFFYKPLAIRSIPLFLILAKRPVRNGLSKVSMRLSSANPLVLSIAITI